MRRGLLPVVVVFLLCARCSGDASPPPRWFFTCGDPVCRGYVPPAGIPACTGQAEGAECGPVGAQCDPRDDCNRLLVCAERDPAQQPGGCPR